MLWAFETSLDPWVKGETSVYFHVFVGKVMIGNRDGVGYLDISFILVDLDET